MGSYTLDQRKKRIEKFLEKRSRRIWTKKVKYDVRKNFADSRVRVKVNLKIFSNFIYLFRFQIHSGKICKKRRRKYHERINGYLELIFSKILVIIII